jgi:hypothetical protein
MIPLTSPTKAYNLGVRQPTRRNHENIKFVVKVSRGSLVPAFVQQIDPTPVRMTTSRKLALIMGKFTVEDAIKSIQTSTCVPELVPVEVTI